MDDPKTRALIDTPPAVILKTRKQQVTSVVRDVAAVVAFIALGLGSLGLYKDSKTGSCINSVLSDRNGPNQADQRARDLLAAREAAALQLLPSNQTAAIADIRIALADYQSARAVNDAARASHPLGKC